jgi:hypothetical protein
MREGEVGVIKIKAAIFHTLWLLLLAVKLPIFVR